jgi:hypothetical protein
VIAHKPRAGAACNQCEFDFRMVVPVPWEGAFRAAVCPQHALAIPPWHGFDFRFHEKFILKKVLKRKNNIGFGQVDRRSISENPF